MTIPKFTKSKQSFHTELKKRIHDYFQHSGKSTTGNFRLYLKAIILVVSFAAIYTHLIFFTPSPFPAILECLAFGALTASIGFNVMHDGAHGSFSRYGWINHLAGLSLNFLGANNFMWRTKHNVIHHSYTNIDGVDDDIDARPFLRLCDTQKYYKIHKYQHLYFWAAYSLLYLFWIFFTDYKKYFRGKVGSVPLAKMKTWDHISFWTFKILYVFIFMLIPIYFVGFMPWLIGYLIYGLFAGFVLSIVFQLAHIVEDTHFPVVNETTDKIDDEWALHQLKTTANFATRNRLISWFVGGLNFQIEHHLFPKISHIHYPAISRIIRKACKEFGMPYIEYPRLSLAVISHVSFLRQMGRRPKKF
ncbi:MAG TPA: acyl-CoA desaturase [Chitinophagaceae bacterium]|nr:acyl-CoA desaturase [Chitinophagaceae bacterium]